MTDTLCVRGDTCRRPHADGTPDSPRHAADGLLLCARCRDLLAEVIDDLSDAHTQLAAILHPGATTGQSTGRSGTLPSERWPARPGVIAARDQIRHDLVWWAMHVIDTRGLTGPSADQVPVIAEWLVGHVDWLAARPEADEVLAALLDVRSQARSLLAPNATRRFRVRGPSGQDAPCPELIDDPDDPEAQRRCDGTLMANLRPADDLLPSALVCTADDTHTVTADAWVTIGRRMRREGVA